jgi:hypothetical protein
MSAHTHVFTRRNEELLVAAAALMVVVILGLLVIGPSVRIQPVAVGAEVEDAIQRVRHANTTAAAMDAFYGAATGANLLRSWAAMPSAMRRWTISTAQRSNPISCAVAMPAPSATALGAALAEVEAANLQRVKAADAAGSQPWMPSTAQRPNQLAAQQLLMRRYAAMGAFYSSDSQSPRRDASAAARGHGRVLRRQGSGQHPAGRGCQRCPGYAGMGASCRRRKVGGSSTSQRGHSVMTPTEWPFACPEPGQIERPS